MEKKLLACDVCGGKITIQAGGKRAICEYCGAEYTIERLKEKFDGIKVSVTGSSDDVEQWRTLTKTYVKNCDFKSAEKTVKRILEASPEDEYANDLYAKLQDWKYMEVKNGVLVKYHGQASDVVIPNRITIIGREAFISDDDLRPFNDRLISVEISEGVSEIESEAFYRCSRLKEVKIPDTVTYIGDSAFKGCGSLASIRIPPKCKKIDREAFCDCGSLTDVTISEETTEFKNTDFAGSPWGSNRIARDVEVSRCQNGLCRYCGGEFKGIVQKKCVKCGRRKDY